MERGSLPPLVLGLIDFAIGLLLSLALGCALVAGLVAVVAAQQNDVGSPAFKERSSSTMTLRYGFRGAAVLDLGEERLREARAFRQRHEGEVVSQTVLADRGADAGHETSGTTSVMKRSICSTALV